MEVQTPYAKLVITTCRDCGSAEWIKTLNVKQKTGSKMQLTCIKLDCILAKKYYFKHCLNIELLISAAYYKVNVSPCT